MIKTFSTLSLAALMALTFAGCGGAEPTPPKKEFAACMIDGAEAPEWVCGTEAIGGEIVGVGSHPRGKASMDFVLSQAQLSGRAKLATQIETKVQAATKNFIQTTGVGEGQKVDDVAQRTAKEVAEVTMTGSRQIAMWQNPANHDVYVLMAIKEDVLVKKTQEVIQSSFDDKNAQWQQYQADQAFKQVEADLRAQAQ